MLFVQIESVGVNLFLLITLLSISISIHGGLVARLILFVERSMSFIVAFLPGVLLQFLLNSLDISLSGLVVIFLELIEHINQEMYILHAVDVETLSNGVNLDGELLLV